MSRRFRIALSFSGTKRAFVADAAKALAAQFGQDKVLYDKFHVAEFARGDLAFHLPALYHSESDLVVVVLSKDYESKDWCGLEWSAVYGLMKQHKHMEVMLCRFDQAEAQGLFGLAGFVDLDEKTPAELARLIFERLAINDGLVRDAYSGGAATGVGVSAGPAWPQSPPLLEWPVADHTEARKAFGQLITHGPPFQVLPIHGGTETGKSHLTKQVLYNALKVPGVTCGRFDFKGSADMDAELQAFADTLGVPSPAAGTGVSGQLAQVFAALRKAATPTLLIFDTFELAGDAERWVRDSLLLATIRAPWLRIVIVGQRVPMPQGEPWAAVSSPPIELRTPSPEDWFAYGQPVNPELTLEFVKTALKHSKGKSSVMALLCRGGN